MFLSGRARVRVSRGEDAAEVRVAPAVLAQERDVCVARLGPGADRHLRTGDRPQTQRLRRMGELEGAVDAVVVGQRERLVAELHRPGGELLRQRRPVQERERRMAMKLYISVHLVSS